MRKEITKHGSHGGVYTQSMRGGGRDFLERRRFWPLPSILIE
jgi:hypothetical protein